MKKLIYLAFAGMLSCSSMPDKGDIFKGGDHDGKYVNSLLVDLNKDKTPDILVASYDMNENGVIDTYAMFKITSLNYPNITTEKTARGVYVDSNEDEIIDYLLIDEDSNGTLEKKVTDFKKLKKENKKQNDPDKIFI